MALEATENAELSPEEAVIYAMVVTAASDGDMNRCEMRTIGRVVRSFSLFADFDEEDLVEIAENCGGLMAQDDGLRKVLDAVKRALPPHLYETAYAAAVDVATADETLNLPELRVMDLMRETLEISDEGAQSIERAARARHMTLDPDTPATPDC
ncbi:MAG: tellurite resistance TerB family protein [Parvularculaceae bacterium]